MSDRVEKKIRQLFRRVNELLAPDAAANVRLFLSVLRSECEQHGITDIDKKSINALEEELAHARHRDSSSK